MSCYCYPLQSIYQGIHELTITIEKFTLPPLAKTGIIPPFGKGRLGGILQLMSLGI